MYDVFRSFFESAHIDLCTPPQKHLASYPGRAFTQSSRRQVPIGTSYFCAGPYKKDELQTVKNIGVVGWLFHVALWNNALVNVDLNFAKCLLVSLQEGTQCHPQSFGSVVVDDEALCHLDRGRL